MGHFWYTYANWNISTSVPEPATALLMGIGLLGFDYIRRKYA
jgi:hypothetical protein